MDERVSNCHILSRGLPTFSHKILRWIVGNSHWHKMSWQNPLKLSSPTFYWSFSPQKGNVVMVYTLCLMFNLKQLGISMHSYIKIYLFKLPIYYHIEPYRCRKTLSISNLFVNKGLVFTELPRRCIGILWRDTFSSSCYSTKLNTVWILIGEWYHTRLPYQKK